MEKIKSLIKQKIVSNEEYDKIISDKHRVKIENGEYTIDKIKILGENGTLSLSECSDIINSIHKEKIKSGEYNIEDIKNAAKKGEISAEKADSAILRIYKEKINTGEYNTNDIKLLKNRGEISNELYKSTIKNIHLNNITDRVYSDEKITKLLDEDCFSIDDLKDILSKEECKKFEYVVEEVPFLKWENVPAVVKGQTDVLMLGVPNSGKTSFMSGLLYYAQQKGFLFYEMTNFHGAK